MVVVDILTLVGFIGIWLLCQVILRCGFLKMAVTYIGFIFQNKQTRVFPTSTVMFTKSTFHTMSLIVV